MLIPIIIMRNNSLGRVDKRHFSDDEKNKKHAFIDNKEKELHDTIANMILQNIKSYQNDFAEYKKNNETKIINIQDAILCNDEINNVIDWGNDNVEQESDKIIDSLKKSITQRLPIENDTVHSMKARSAILNSGVLDELANAINEVSRANTVIEKELQSMVNKAHQENKV